jgi:adenosylcobinamide-phosphate synthase
MGWIISFLTNITLKTTENNLIRRIAGIFIAIILIFGSGLIGWGIVKISYHIHPLMGIIIETMMLASCFAGKSLNNAGKDVLTTLETGDLQQTRITLSQYVGRDTENLTETEILRAILETISENATDGVTAPLFYAIVGATVSFLGSVPLALAYKAASTLDSMIGYKLPPYTYIGWFSARFEDYLTWIPCRLTVLTLALISGKPRQVWQICCRDAMEDPSPNSGWSECVYAAILGVQLGGTNCYQGIVKNKPLLGDSIHPITPEIIKKSLQITRYCFLTWLIFPFFSIIIPFLLSLSNQLWNP